MDRRRLSTSELGRTCAPVVLRVPSQCPPWWVCVASLTPKKAKRTIPSQAAHESLGHSCLFAVESCRGRSPRAERICVMRSSLYLLQQGVFSSNSQSEIRLGRYPMASLDDQPFLPFVQVPRQLRGMVRVRWHLPSERPMFMPSRPVHKKIRQSWRRWEGSRASSRSPMSVSEVDHLGIGGPSAMFAGCNGAADEGHG